MSMSVMSASLVTPILLETGRIVSRVSCTVFVLDVTFPFNFFWLLSSIGSSSIDDLNNLVSISIFLKFEICVKSITGSLQYSDSDLKAINDIVRRAHTDPEFRINLFKNPNTILDQFNVSDKVKSLILDFFNE